MHTRGMHTMHKTICNTICIEKFLLVVNFEYLKISLFIYLVKTWDVTRWWAHEVDCGMDSAWLGCDLSFTTGLR
jgi:hypothetical protein